MEKYEEFLAEEIFFTKLRLCNVLTTKDVAGKDCLVICAMGGAGVWRKIFGQALKKQLVEMGTARCDNMLLFNGDDLNSFCDLTDVNQALGTSSYDYIIVLGGMEKTWLICEGVCQLQAACRPGGKIFVVAKTPKEISAWNDIHAYEDLWRYDAEDLSSLFASCTIEMTATSNDGELVAAVFIRDEGAPKTACRTLFYTRTQTKMDPNGELPRGAFRESAELDSIGIKYRTDKCSMMHDYLGKYEFFLQKFRMHPLRLLELGVFEGSSLRMWQEYFPYAEVYGVDIAENCSQYADERIHIIQADLSDPARVAKLKEIRPQIIIDDASHIVSHQLLALFSLFDVLPSGGVYILEDLETSLNPEQFGESYRDCPLDAYEVCARIARITARKVPDDDSLYAEHINRIGMATELISVTKGTVIFVKR